MLGKLLVFLEADNRQAEAVLPELCLELAEPGHDAMIDQPRIRQVDHQVLLVATDILDAALEGQPVAEDRGMARFDLVRAAIQLFDVEERFEVRTERNAV